MLELNYPSLDNSKLCLHFCAVMFTVYEYLMVGARCPNINCLVCIFSFTDCCGVVYSCLSIGSAS